MPSFRALCCTCSRRLLPNSPTGDQPVVQSSFSKTRADGEQSDGRRRTDDVHEAGDDNATKLGPKLPSVLPDTLLPGQLPESPKGVVHARANVVSAGGHGLLEDALHEGAQEQPGACNAGSLPQPVAEHQQADVPGPAPPTAASLASLAVPSHLLASSSSFDADFRDGELMMSAAGPSGAVLLEPSRQGALPELRSSPPSRAASLSGEDAATWHQLLDPPLGSTVSLRSGRKALYKLCRLPSLLDAVPAPADGPSGTLPAAAAAEHGTDVTAQERRSGSGVLAAHYRGLAWQRLQHELATAAQLPKCPGLLLPQRVYMQSSTVHVVYDGYGVELLAYLLERQRLAEAQCRGVMRQLLQVLATLHEERWVHRNISTETIWVEEEEEEQRPEQDRMGSTPGAAHPPVTTAAAGGLVPMGRTVGLSPLRRGSSDQRQPLPPSRFNPARNDAVLQRREPRPPRLRVRLGGLSWAARQELESGPSGPADPGGSPGRGGGQGAPLRPLQELVGCAYHLAPEAISGAGYGRPADIWAAGVLLYMLLTGRPPFPGANELEVMTRILLAATERAATGGAGSDAGSRRSGSLQHSDPQHAEEGVVASARSTASGSPMEPELRVQAGSVDGTGATSTAGAAGGPDVAAEGSATPAARVLGSPGCRVRRRTGDSETSPRALPHASQQYSMLGEVVVQAVLDANASDACRQVLAGMLVVDPERRLSAAELLRLPWFAAGD